MSTKVASLHGELSLDDSRFRAGLTTSRQNLGNFGNIIQGTGAAAQGLGDRLSNAGQMGVNALMPMVEQAGAFGTSMTNVQAVLNKTDDEMAELNATILDIGADAVAGPQAVADAYYDVVGGVADATTHMDILNQAIATSEAGNADLTATTGALIGVMNSYGFEADQAAFASDVLTRTVGMGFGTMNDFAAALPAVTSVANSMGIEFNDLAAMTAYLTTQGSTASEATTQLGAAMTAMLKPNDDMIAALAEIGFESGTAAVEQLGLAGAYQALADKFGDDAVISMTEGIEDLRFVTALTGGDFSTFADTFTTGITGATDEARQIQRDNPAADWALLNSQYQATSITLGNAMMPALTELMKVATPIIQAVGDWAEANPQLTTTIVGLTGAAVVLGPIIGGIGTAISVATGIVGLFAGATGAAVLPLVALGGALIVLKGQWDNLYQSIKPNLDIINQGLANGQFNIGDVFNAAGTAIVQEFTPRASGGPVSGGESYRVGENGPELFMPSSSGMILPNTNTGGGTTLNINGMTIHANSAAEGRAAARGAWDELQLQLARV